MKGVALLTRLRRFGLGKVTLATLSALWIGWLLLEPRADSTAHVSNLGLTLMPSIAGVRCLRRSRSLEGRIRRAWWLLGLSALAWAAGMGVWTWYESAMGREVPFPSAADLGYLGAVPLAVAGMLAIATQRMTSLLRAILDGLVIAASLLFVSWALVLGPVFRAGDGSLVAQLISLAYPFGDLVTITIVLVALPRCQGGGVRKSTLGLLSFGLFAIALSDSGFVYLAIQESYVSGSFIDIGWFLGYGLIFLAACRHAAGAGSVQDEERVPARPAVLLPYSAVFLAVAVAALGQAFYGGLGTFLVWNALALLVLVVGRHILMVLEHLSLLRNLESRVQSRTEELARSEERFRSLVTNSSDVVTVVDVDSTIRYQSPSAQRVFGHDHAALAGTLLSDLVDQDDRPRFLELLGDATAHPFSTTVAEFGILDSQGHRSHAEMTITNLLEDPSVAGLVLNTRDVTERKRLEEELVHQAFHDSLTGLANRALFKDRVQHAISRQRRWRRRVAVLFLDLDGFKAMNDSFGHNFGDQILAAVGERLRAALRTCDTAARLGGDEFAVLVEDLTGESGAVAAVQRLSEALLEGFTIEGREVMVTASTGIAFAETGNETADELLRNADLAMYRAKMQGRGTYRRYEPTMHSGVVERVELEADLRQALGKGEMSLHYQPIVDLRTGRISGVEALLRWHHPIRGFVSPMEFIPIAESNGLIVPIGEWVLGEACRQVRSWQERLPGYANLSVSVNLSARQVQTSGLVTVVLHALEKSGLDARTLTLEMTESIVMEHAEDTLSTLGELRDLGIRLAIDDFGTGYSSLSYLHRFPVDVVKIDRSFITRLTSEAEEAALACSIVRIGQAMHLATVAEGIETPEQLDLLRDMGCELGQGFLFARPMPAADLEDHLRAQSGPAAGEELVA